MKGETVEEMLSVLEHVFKRLREAKLTLNLEKCCFGERKVVFMGLLIKNGTVRPAEDKITAITRFPVPTTPTQVRQFLIISIRFLSSTHTGVRQNNRLVVHSNLIQGRICMKTSAVGRVRSNQNTHAETELHTDASVVGLGGKYVDPVGRRSPPLSPRHVSKMQRGRIHLESLPPRAASDRVRPGKTQIQAGYLLRHIRR